MGILGVSTVNAASTPTFNQTINPGTLNIDIVNGSYVAVGSPAVTMGAVTFSFATQTATGTLGTASEQIYVQNPDGADNGWDVSLAAANVADLWDGPTSSFDFNDPTGSGATNGQMTINASVGVGATGACANCSMTGVSLGSSTAFDSTGGSPVNSITLMTGASGSDDIGDWTLRGLSISQKIPKEKPAEAYAISMVVSILAK